MLFGIPADYLIPIIGILAGTTMTGVLLYPFARALANRLQSQGATRPSADVAARLARIETAVESIAVEVERISEGQRYLTKQQSGTLPRDTPERPR
jgi:hypothetical protein